jgi:hypothetical protein
MGLEGSLLYWQELATDPNRELDKNLTPSFL